MKIANFKKNDVIVREGKKFQCVVCDNHYACFARYTRVAPDQEHTDFNEVFLTINNAEQHFEFEKLSPMLGNEN